MRGAEPLVTATPCDFLVSVVIPVYNTSRGLLQRCASLFVHTPCQGVEVLFSDDGSSNTTVSALQQIVENSKTPMRLLTSASNGGQNAARNRGIATARGRYVMFLDSDDYFDEHEFVRVLDAIRDAAADDKQSSPDVFVYGCKRVDGGSGRIIDGYSPAEEKVGVVSNSLVLRNVAELWGCVIRRELLLAEPLRTGVTVGEDLVSLIPIIATASKIIALPFSPYRYVQQNESVMHSVSAAKRMQIVPAFQSMLESMSAATLSKYHDELEWQAIWHILFWESLHVLQSAERPEYSVLESSRDWVEKYFPQWRENPYLKTDPKSRGLSFRIITSGRYRFYRFLFLAKRRL